MRICPVCKQEIRETRKAQAIETGAGTTMLIHDRCAKALNSVIEDMNVGIGTIDNGTESGVGVSTVNSKPCVCGDGMVHDGSSITIGNFEYACHRGCKQLVLEMIAEALEPGNLQDAHYDSIIRNLGA